MFFGAVPTHLLIPLEVNTGLTLRLIPFPSTDSSNRIGHMFREQHLLAVLDLSKRLRTCFTVPPVWYWLI